MKWKIHPGNTKQSFRHDSTLDWTSWHRVRQVRAGMRGPGGNKSRCSISLLPQRNAAHVFKVWLKCDESILCISSQIPLSAYAAGHAVFRPMSSVWFKHSTLLIHHHSGSQQKPSPSSCAMSNVILITSECLKALSLILTPQSSHICFKTVAVSWQALCSP